MISGSGALSSVAGLSMRFSVFNVPPVPASCSALDMKGSFLIDLAVIDLDVSRKHKRLVATIYAI